MKKLLFAAFTVLFGGIFVTNAKAQAVPPGAGTPVFPEASLVEIVDCAKFPKVPNCSSPEFQRLVESIDKNQADAFLKCCVENTRGGKGGDDGRNKYYCEKLIKTDYTDSDGCPKYAYPTNPKLTMPPCDSRAWVQGEGPCCIPSERCHAGNEKGGKGGRDGKPNPYCSEAALGVPKCAPGVIGKCCIPDPVGKGAKANKPAQQIKNEKPQQAVIMMSTGTLPSIPRPSTIPSTRTAPYVK